MRRFSVPAAEPPRPPPALRVAELDKPAAWRDIPDGPRDIVAGMIGEQDVEHVGGAEELRRVLPAARTVLRVAVDPEAPFVSLLEALDRPVSQCWKVENVERDNAARLVEAIATQRGYDRLALSGAGVSLLTAVALGLSAASSSWTAVDVSNSLGTEAATTIVRALVAHRDSAGGGRALRELSMTGAHVDSHFATDLGSALGHTCIALRKLRLKDVTGYFRDHHAQVVCRGLLDNDTMQELTLENCDIGPESAVYLCDVLRKSKSLRTLRLNRNETLNDLAGATLVGGLVRNTALKELRLAKCAIGPATGGAIGLALGLERSALRKLCLCGNPGLGDQGAAAVARGLACNCVVRDVCIQACDLAFASAVAFAEALAFRHSALGKLDLSKNARLDETTGVLVSGLERNNGALVKLNLKGCNLGRDSAAVLARLLYAGSLRHTSLYLGFRSKAVADRWEAAISLADASPCWWSWESETQSSSPSPSSAGSSAGSPSSHSS